MPSLSRHLPGLALVLCLPLLTACADAASFASAAQTVRISGSTTVNPVAADAAEVLRGDDLQITVDTQGGSSGGLQQLVAGQIDIAMSSKPVSDSDRKAAPGVDFVAHEIGADAVGIVVDRAVVDGGLTSLDRTQLQRLFEGRIANWSELGGPDLPVFVYDKEPGRGTREVLDSYLYGKNGQAPPPPDSPRFAVVGGNEETRTKLLSTPGAVGPLSSAFVEGEDELALLAIDGVLPTPETIAGGSYELSRPLFLVTNGPPTGAAERFVDFVTGAEGQPLLTKHGYLTLAQLSG